MPTGNLDIVTVSAFNKANDTSSVWMTAWINDGHENFTPVPLAQSPTHLITLAVGISMATGCRFWSPGDFSFILLTPI